MKFKHLRVSGQRLVKWPAGCTGSPWLRRTRSRPDLLEFRFQWRQVQQPEASPFRFLYSAEGTNGVHLQGSNPSPDVSCGIRRT